MHGGRACCPPGRAFSKAKAAATKRSRSTKRSQAHKAPRLPCFSRSGLGRGKKASRSERSSPTPFCLSPPCRRQLTLPGGLVAGGMDATSNPWRTTLSTRGHVSLSRRILLRPAGRPGRSMHGGRGVNLGPGFNPDSTCADSGTKEFRGSHRRVPKAITFRAKPLRKCLCESGKGVREVRSPTKLRRGANSRETTLGTYGMALVHAGLGRGPRLRVTR